MELLRSLGYGFQLAGSPGNLIVIVFGVVAGILVGAMPGLSPSMGVALLVPFTYAMDSTTAVYLLGAVLEARRDQKSLPAYLVRLRGEAIQADQG